MNRFLEVNSGAARDAPSTRRISATQELPLSRWYRRMCKCHNPVTSAIPGCNRSPTTGGRDRRQGIAQVLPRQVSPPRARFLPFIIVSEFRNWRHDYWLTFVCRGRLSQLGHKQCRQHRLLLFLEPVCILTVGILGIIVRDEAARQSFKTEIGRVGVTL